VTPDKCQEASRAHCRKINHIFTTITQLAGLARPIIVAIDVAALSHGPSTAPLLFADTSKTFGTVIPINPRDTASAVPFWHEWIFCGSSRSGRPRFRDALYTFD